MKQMLVLNQLKSVKQNMKENNKEYGAVIIVALFIVAIIAGLSYYMLARLERDTYRTQLLLRSTQAEMYAQGSIDWAKQQLKDNLSHKKANQPVDTLPIESPDEEINGYIISAKITDMQSTLNLNMLKTKEAQDDFVQLVHLVDAEINQQTINDLVKAIVDWINPGQVQNEYNKYYMGLPQPYRAAHRPMMSATELQLVKGMTADLFRRLQPYITALPSETKINIKTAPAVIIASLSKGMSLQTAREIEMSIRQKDIANIDDLAKLDIIKNHPLPKERLTTESQYFLLETRVKIEKQQVVLYTLLERTGNESKNAVRVVWQSKGVPG
jgi:general secretion pathway protein K